MDLLIQFLMGLEPKDRLTLIVSVLALGVSALSYAQKSDESDLALRKQLTDLLEKLTDLNLEAGKFRANKDGFPDNYLGLLNDQRRFLVRQADFIVERITSLVSPFEYLLLAGGFDEINDDVKAVSFFEQAIDVAVHPIDKAIATRSYARYLFGQGRLDEGRARYRDSMAGLAGDSPRVQLFRVNTLERWSSQEREWNALSEADSLLERALAEAQQFTNPSTRSQTVQRLTKLRVGLPPKSTDLNRAQHEV